MNTRLLFVALSIAGLSSCSTAYRTGQTPDDVYYSPDRPAAAYVSTKNSEENPRYNDSYSGSNYYESREDMYLRMMVRNHYRWSAYDDYYYGMDSYYNPHMYYSNPWAFSYNPYSYSAFNNYYSWNRYYNPYCSNIVILNPVKNPTYYNKIKTFNLNAYNNTSYSNRNATNKVKNFGGSGANPAYGIPYGGVKYSNSNSYQVPMSGKKSYGTSNSKSYEYNSSSDRPVRSYSPSNNSGSSSGGSRSGGSSGGSSSGGSSSGSRPGRG